MFVRRRGAPWLPALIAGGIGAAVLSRRARWHAMQGGPGERFGRYGGYGSGRGIPPVFEEMLDTWHKKAHGEAPPKGDSPDSPGEQT